MSGENIDEVIKAMFANTKMEARQSYLTRGRSLQLFDSEKLRVDWLSQMNAWANGWPGFQRQLMDDIESELEFRNLEAPYEQAAEAVAKLVQWTREMQERSKSNPDNDSRANERLEIELRKVLPKRADKN
jgi:hypothetical protein